MYKYVSCLLLSIGVLELLLWALFGSHATLIIGNIIGGLLVGFGILLEKPENPTFKQKFAHWLVMIGIVKEPLFMLMLFNFDEGISNVQQDTIKSQQVKILSLETCLAARHISPDKQRELTNKLRSFSGVTFDAAIGPRGDPEPLYLLRAIHSSLVMAGWKPTAWTTGELLTEPPMSPVGETMVTNVIIDVGLSHRSELGNAATALAKALTDVGIDAIADSNSTSIDTDAIHVRIGRRLCFAEPPRESGM